MQRSVATDEKVDNPIEPPVQYLEASDVARVLELSYSGVYALVQSGALKPAGVTLRGVRLFLAVQVEELRALRQSRREGRSALVGA